MESRSGATFNFLSPFLLHSLVNFLLDEILGSAVHRCLESVLMEPNAVEIICERG